MTEVILSILAKFADKFAEKISDIFLKKEDLPDSIPAEGGNANTVNNHTVDSDVPAGAVFTDTTYGNMEGATADAPGVSGLVPAPGKGAANRYLRSDGTWVPLDEGTDEDIENIINGLFE